MTSEELLAAYAVGERNFILADLHGADLSVADLRGAKINWQSHDTLAEILRRAAGDDMHRRMVAGCILVSRDWCWVKFLALPIAPELRAWALDTLRPFVAVEGAEPPAALIDALAELDAQRPAREA